MAPSEPISAWIAILIGLFALAAGAGELRQAGGWERRTVIPRRVVGEKLLQGETPDGLRKEAFLFGEREVHKIPPGAGPRPRLTTFPVRSR